MFVQAERERYQRHFFLQDMGVKGQLALKNGRVLCIGAGGIGCPAAQYLMAAGVGTLGIVDADTVERSNLQRQILFAEADIGHNKAVCARRHLKAQNPHCAIIAYDHFFPDEQPQALLADYDVVIDGSDNFATRYRVNDECVKAGKPLISASVWQHQALVGVYNVAESGCYRCVFPEPPAPGAVPACAAAGVLGIITGIAGTFAAGQAIAWLAMPEALLKGCKRLDWRGLVVESFAFTADPACQVCADALVSAPRQYKTAITMSEDRDRVIQLSPAELQSWQQQAGDFKLIDVREQWERDIAHLADDIHMPLSNGLDWSVNLDQTLVVYCHHGVRSQQVAEQLVILGADRVANLRGGIDAWANEIDPAMARY